MEINDQTLDGILHALAEQLQSLGAAPQEIVVIGGSALLALGFTTRATKDVDVVALAEGGELRSAKPLPLDLQTASERIARDYGLDQDWLNPGPTDLILWGLPQGFMERLTRREYGPSLSVHFASRLDQIHFKLYALADHGGGRHETDLRVLEPSERELVEAAKWVTTHDPSPAFRTMLTEALRTLGVEDADFST